MIARQRNSGASAEPSERSEIREDAEMSERNILGELMEGVAAMKSHREGKLTLRTYKTSQRLPSERRRSIGLC